MNARRRMNKHQQLSPRVLRERRANGEESKPGGTMIGSPAHEMARRVRQQILRRTAKAKEQVINEA